MVGSAIGLGSLCIFPAAVSQHGGGWFLLLYALFVALLGLPLLWGEIALGQTLQGGVYGVLQRLHHPYLSLFFPCSCILLLSFYNVITGWVIGYLCKLLNGTLLEAEELDIFFKTFTANWQENLIYTTAASLLVLLIIRAGVKEGIGVFSKFFLPLYLALLLALIWYVCHLKGAGQGINFYLSLAPDRLTWRSVGHALSLACFTLSLGMGALIVYGHYMEPTTDLFIHGIAVAGSVILISFLSGLLIFPLLYSQGLEASHGLGLIFIALPRVLQQLPGAMPYLVGLLFLVLTLFAAISSGISLLEVPTHYLMERYGWTRHRSVWLVGLVTMLLSLPSMLSLGAHAGLSHLYKGEGFLTLTEAFCSKLLLPYGALLTNLIWIQSSQKHDLLARLRQSSYWGAKQIAQVNGYLLTYVTPCVLGSMLIGHLGTWLYNGN